MFQSTPPVAGGRCNATTIPVNVIKMFQSTPPVAGGRCAPVENADQSFVGVSIHAPRCRGAMRSRRTKRDRSGCVSIHAPRCRGAMHARAYLFACDYLFQSTPPVAGGRCGKHFRCDVPVRHVSIHAPRCRGAMPISSGSKTTRSRFQSTPPVAGGRCVTR